MRISIAHATRRPQLALDTKTKWLAAATQPDRIEWIFGIDYDDDVSLRLLHHERHAISAAGAGCNVAFNEAAALTHGEIIIGCTDDAAPIAGWDDIIAQRFDRASAGTSELKPMVLLVGDGHRTDRLATLTIVTRAWYRRFGYILPPQFKSVGADIWLSERASRDGCLVDASDLIFEHLHPFYGKAPMDAVYEKQNAPERYVECEQILRALLEPLPITLCMIAGNEGETLIRCLHSAKDAFDELCLVRAIGEQPADNTVDLAAAWCVQNQKRYSFAEYTNTVPGFRHVDNFAAARNLSFSLATGFWCLWLDADDLLDAENCRLIREASSNSRFEAHCFVYQLENGGEFFRERLIKRGSGHWRGAVHEVCQVTGLACQIEQVKIRHCPAPDKRGGPARNLAILETVCGMSIRGQETLNSKPVPRDWFYYHEELMRVGRKADALYAGRLTVLRMQDGGYPVELYETLLNLMDLDSAHAPDHAFAALSVDPLRREALCLLVQYEMQTGSLARACQYFKWLDSIPEPKPRPWTHRAIWYGWARNYLRVMLLRALGKQDAAAAEHAKNLADPAYAAGVAVYEPKLAPAV